MNKVKYILCALLLSLFVIFPLYSENISLKFTYNHRSFNGGDLNDWINSYNSLWEKWSNAQGGNYEGQFPSFTSFSNYEGELRIHIFSGLSLNLAASHISLSKEGTISYQNNSGTQKESQLIRNVISATPIKIGFSFAYPFIENFYVYINAGRHIIFVNYNNTEDYDAVFTLGEEEFNYWYEKEFEYKSEDLGYYLCIGAEYDVFKSLSLVVEAEKIWAQVDGFKGSFTKEYYDDSLDKEGKASLYYYNSTQWGLDKAYPVLTGHKERPESELISDIRQGKLDFSGISLKLGLRIKF